MDKKWWQSKTMWFGILVCLLGFLEQLQQVPNLPPGVLVVIGVLIVILRAITSTGIAK